VTRNHRGDRAAEHTDSSDASLTRRDFFKGAGLTGLTAACPLSLITEDANAGAADGTPEQIHLTWGDDPSSGVFVSWCSPAQAVNPRVLLRGESAEKHTIHGIQRTYTDGLNGQTVFTYHAKLDGLHPGSTFHYAVTADNDRNRARPFNSTFQTATRGRVAFRWTSYGDLATPVTSWVLSSPRARAPTCAWSNRASGRISSRPTREPSTGGSSSLQTWSRS